MNEMNQTVNKQNFFDTLAAATVGDVKKSVKWYIIIAAVGFVIALLLLLAEQPLGAAFFAVLGALMVISLMMEKKKARKMESGSSGDLSYVTVHGATESKEEMIRRLNADYDGGRLLYCSNKDSVRVFLFPSYVVFTLGATIHVIAESSLYWAYFTVHKQDGVESGYVVSFFTAMKMVNLHVPDREGAEELIEQLARNYSIWVGFDSKLKRLYSKDKVEFIRRMDEFKWYKKVPVDK